MTSMSLNGRKLTFLRLDSVFLKLPKTDLVLNGDWKKGFLRREQGIEARVRLKSDVVEALTFLRIWGWACVIR